MSLRAGPLSDEKVIALLNGYYIPVYAPYTSEETISVVSSEEEKEIQRIWGESLAKKLGYGMVHVYLLEPGTGSVFDSLGVVKASITNETCIRSWTVTDKHGTVFTYGGAAAPSNPNSPSTSPSVLSDPNDSCRISRWGLTSVQDTFGNLMTVSYAIDGVSATSGGSTTAPGGGGGAGRIRINTTSGAASVSGLLSPSSSCVTQGQLKK